jgi:plastocyanin
MRTTRALALPAALLLLVVGLSACGSDGGDGGAASSGSAATVSIKDFAVSPATLRVTAGDEVTISNDDGAEHTFTLDDGSYDSGHLASGRSVTHTFDSAGSFSYHCEIHTNMKGTIEVG